MDVVTENREPTGWRIVLLPEGRAAATSEAGLVITGPLENVKRAVSTLILAEDD